MIPEDRNGTQRDGIPGDRIADCNFWTGAHLIAGVKPASNQQSLDVSEGV